MFDAPYIRPLITADEIARRVRELGAEIARDYGAERRVPHAVAVLKGACVFASDLLREVPLPVTLDFIAVSSYGGAMKTSGEVRLVKDLDESVEGRDLLLIEDIVDTGLTLAFLSDTLKRRGASSVRVAALLDKPSRRRVEIAPDYVGFQIGDEFVIGYGLDFDGKYRNLPYVGVATDPSRL